MRKSTAEDMYNEYHKQAMFASKGIYPKSIVNWTKIHASQDWVFFEKFAKYINDNSGYVDYKLYMTALGQFYSGRCNPKLLGGMKALKVYKQFIRMQEFDNDPDSIEKSAMKSIKVVIEFCAENNLDFMQYLNDGYYMVPTLAKHFSAGSISKHFIAMIPNIDIIIKNFPPDFASELIDFLDNFDRVKITTMRIKQLKAISTNMVVIMNTLINQYKE